MVTAGIGGAYLDVTHGLATELKLLPQASRNWREGDDDATFVQQPVMLPEPRGLAGLVAAARQAVAPRSGSCAATRACSRRSPLTHFTIFLLLLLIFWQGIRANETGLIIDAYLSATPRELAEFAGGLLAVVLLGVRHLPAADSCEDDHRCSRSR